MAPRLFRQTPAVETIIGGDAARGWIPPGAAEPLPHPPSGALLDVRIVEDATTFSLTWSAHDPAAWSLPSARGNRSHASLEAALSDAEVQFGVAASDWLIAPDGRKLSAAEVGRIVAASLAAHEFGEAWDDGWGRLVDPPRLESFRLDTGTVESLWLVLESDRAHGYVVFYDGQNGDFGLGTRDSDGLYTYVGNYGPLWSTLVSM